MIKVREVISPPSSVPTNSCGFGVLGSVKLMLSVKTYARISLNVPGKPFRFLRLPILSPASNPAYRLSLRL